MRDKGLSHGYLTARVALILSYLELNDITINRKKLRKFFGEAIKTVKDEAYTREEIQKCSSLPSLGVDLLLQYTPALE